MMKQGYPESTLRITSQRLRYLNKHCNLDDPESVKAHIANKKVSNGYKRNLVRAYSYYAKVNEIQWDRPYSLPNGRSIRVDVSWKKGKELIVWEVELKARYEEKLFSFHLLREKNPNITGFSLVVQRNDSKKQVQKIANKFFSRDENSRLTILTVNKLTGESIEEQPKQIPPLFWAHRESPYKCVALFSPCPFDDGFNRGIRLTGIYLKERGYSLEEIGDYIEWLAYKLGLPPFEVNSALKYIEKNRFPPCEKIQEMKSGRGPHILSLGDLDILQICKNCPFFKNTSLVDYF